MKLTPEERTALDVFLYDYNEKDSLELIFMKIEADDDEIKVHEVFNSYEGKFLVKQIEKLIENVEWCVKSKLRQEVIL